MSADIKIFETISQESSIRVAKKNDYSHRLDANKNSIKTTWREINKILGKSKTSSIPDDLTDGQKVISNPLSAADAFNDYFSNIGSSLAENIPPADTHFFDYLRNPSSSSFFLSPTSFHEICSSVLF